MLNTLGKHNSKQHVSKRILNVFRYSTTNYIKLFKKCILLSSLLDNKKKQNKDPSNNHIQQIFSDTRCLNLFVFNRRHYLTLSQLD